MKILWIHARFIATKSEHFPPAAQQQCLSSNSHLSAESLRFHLNSPTTNVPVKHKIFNRHCFIVMHQCTSTKIKLFYLHGFVRMPLVQYAAQKTCPQSDAASGRFTIYEIKRSRKKWIIQSKAFNQFSWRNPISFIAADVRSSRRFQARHQNFCRFNQLHKVKFRQKSIFSRL